MDDIAVIGLGLRFPGDASSPEALWEVLEKGESQWSEIPNDRLNINGYYHPSGNRQGSISFKGAHFLKGNVANFDAPFFSIAAADAEAIDPQQRLLLEICYEALENAGCTKEGIDGTDTSVYVGSFVKDYEQICLRDPDWQPQYAATGNGIAIMANRISYFFNLHGPSMTIDTGCSGSLVSVHLAAQSLRTGESSLAIAAGVGLILTPSTIMPMTALNFLSADGKCFTFDARANGYGRGEGVGVVILKRMSDAIRDNDTIRAVIRGTQVNQDGRTTGITLPSKEAQVANIRAVYKAAGIPFGDTAYVECHGTGTQAGDWRELKAISETLGASRATENPIFVGSIKPNIGHLEGAAGVAGLIKAVLMLEHERIPPHINFETPNPAIDFKDWKIQVSRIAQDWPPNLKRRISVNCFGFGGTNAHLILDGASEYLSTRKVVAPTSCTTTRTTLQNGYNSTVYEASDEHIWYLICFSSNERSGLSRMRESHASMLETRTSMTKDFLPNYSYTLGCRRSQLEWRTFLVAHSVSHLVAQLKEPELPAKRSTKALSAKLCFLFCGQGSQWEKMGSDLQSFPVFRESLSSATLYLKEVLGSPYDLMQEISSDISCSQLSEPVISQPATTAIQIALVELLQSMAIEPNFVVGHSSGEIAAAFACGAISREDAWEAAYYRGLAASDLQHRLPGFQGGMIAVSMTLDQATAYVSALADPLEIACINSPNSITLSGRRETIRQVSSDLAAKTIPHRVLHVKTAYHSSYMNNGKDDYIRSIASISPSNSRKSVRMFSSVTGAELDGSSLDASYWGENMVSMVRFSSALDSLMELPEDQRPSIFIEMGPSTVLRTPVLDTLSLRVSEEAYLSVLDKRRPGMASVLNVVGHLWSSGYKLNLESAISLRFPQPRVKCLTDLPAYPWNHLKAYWHESHLSLANRFRENGRLDLIGAPTADSVSFEPRWRGFLRISENPWIQDHQVQNTIIYPAAGIISMVLEAARQLKKNFPDITGYELRNTHFEKAIIVPNTAHGVEVALNMRAEKTAPNERQTRGQFTFSVYSKGLERDWERHATGILYFCSHSPNWDAIFRAFSKQQDDVAASCRISVNPKHLYEHLDTIGISYGPLFQNMVEVKKDIDRCVSRVCVPDTKSKMPANFEYPHLLHPGTLDSMFQTLFALNSNPKIPYFMQSIFVSDNLDLSTSREFVGHAIAKPSPRDEARISMCCTDRPLDQIIIRGVRFSGDLFSLSAGPTFLPNHRNLATEIIWRENSGTAKIESLRHAISLSCHKYPSLSVLQIGGNISVTRCILLSAASNRAQPPRLGRYTLIDQDESDLGLSDVFTTQFSCYLEKVSDLAAVLSRYHVVVISGESGDAASQAQRFLKPGGMVLQFCPKSSTSQYSVSDSENIYLGLGWDPVELHDEWRKSTGALLPKPTDELPSISAWKVYTAVEEWKICRTIVLLVPDSLSEESLLFKAQFAEYLTTNYPETTLSACRLRDVAGGESMGNHALYISLLEFSRGNLNGGSIFNWSEADFNAFHLLQKNVKFAIWITRSTNMAPTNPWASAVIGLTRTLMSENIQMNFATFDLDQYSSLSEKRILDLLLTVCRNVTDPALTAEVREMDFAEKDGKLFIPRLEPLECLNKIIEGDDCRNIYVEKSFQAEDVGSSHQIQLEIAASATNEPPVYFTEVELGELGPQSISVSFSSGVLFGGDVRAEAHVASRGRCYDVVGYTASAGENVTQHQKGTKVLALVPDGKGLCTTVQVDSSLVVGYRPGFTPSHFLAAYYALFNSGKLGLGKTVLVHAGGSGFGLAAIELGLLVGATVFATVLGPDAEKQRAILHGRGIGLDHIFDGSNDGYNTIIDLLTHHRGVDVIYDPTYEGIQLSIACVRRGGTVVHFTQSSECRPSTVIPNIPMTMISFDLHTFLTEERDAAIRMLHAVIQLTSNASLDWMSSSGINREFDISKLQDASIDCRKSPHVGAVTVTAGLAQVGGSVVQVLNQNSTKTLHESIAGDSTYVLVGGLGGLGRSITELLAANGAKHVAFLSRSGESSFGASQFLEELAGRGVDAKAFAIDVCNLTALESLMKTELGASMPPIAGIFYCAAVIKDAVFDNMTYGDWSASFRPKALGAWNLVQAVNASEQDPFYVFLASSSGVIGTRGQANYAAGNALLDSLATSLRIQGKRAVSLDLGPILGAGMLADDEAILGILRASGFYGIRHDDFLTVVKHAITLETLGGKPLPSQVILGVGTGGLMLQNQPADPYWSRTALYSYLNIVDMPEPDLTVSQSSIGLDIKTQLQSCTDAEVATDIICSGLSSLLSKSMNMPAEEIDQSRPPSSYGVDSLVAVGVRNWVAGNCGVEISVFEIMSELSVFELSRKIVENGVLGTMNN